jgi:hypothetical protein
MRNASAVDKYSCPVCKNTLTRDEYDSALGILDARQEELAHREEDLQSREVQFESEKATLILEARRAKEKGIEEGRAAEKKRADRALAERREALERQARQLEKKEADFRRQKTELVEKARESLAKGVEQGIECERKRAERLLSG